MNARIRWTGSVALNVLFPWFMLIVIVAGLTGYRLHQTHDNDAMEAHSNLHRKAVLLASDLRFLALQRWSNALAYQATKDVLNIALWRSGELETQSKLDELSHLFSVDDEHYDAMAANQATALLESYRVIRQGHPELYASFIAAVDAGDHDHQLKLIALLNDKIRLVRASLDDLAEYHIKVEQLVEQEQQELLARADATFFGLLGLLILVGLVFSWFQVQAIVRPLSDLTVAAEKVGTGEKVNLARFAGKDEIGALSEALSAMVDALHRSHDEIAARRDQLAVAYAEVEEKVRQRTIELQRRSDELEVANKDLESFSYSVSHDLRAPLRAIDGFIAILREEYGKRLDAEGLRLFGVVSHNAVKMGVLIDDILALSRAGRLELTYTRVDMIAMVEDVWKALEDQRRDRSIEIQIGDLPVVAADPRALRQIWQNLLDNAIKFTRGRNPARIEVGVRVEKDLTWYEVKDNGAGFNPNYADKLFGLFQRLHGTEEFEGTGVGLAIVKRLVQRHGGQVLASGCENTGATFGFALPAGG